MNQTNTTSTVDLLRSLVGRQVESNTGVLLINDVLTRKTGVLKDGSRAPYLHLIAEMGDAPEVDLHPQKALELAKKGEYGAYKILAALASDDNIAPANALNMTVEQVVECTKAAAADQKKESKKAGTLRIYRKMMAKGKARKDIIARMCTELGLSAAGANTYYQNVKSGAWK